MPVRPAVLAALLVAIVALYAAGCGDDEPSQESGAAPSATQGGGDEQGDSQEEQEREEQEARANGGKECADVGDLDGEPKDRPPSDLKVLEGAHVYESEGPFGKTERYFAAVDGEAADLPEKRDAAAKALADAGYKVLATDEEENTEAEAHLQGDDHTVDIQVIALCEGKLRIRYTVS